MLSGGMYAQSLFLIVLWPSGCSLPTASLVPCSRGVVILVACRFIVATVSKARTNDGATEMNAHSSTAKGSD
jgi:hypothetical protein